jgi:hypothetical protein
LIRAASTAALAIVPTIAVFIAYLGTLAPGLLGGDAGELQFASPILSLTHPTGYPFLVLANHFWGQLIPFGTVAWRLTLLDALFAASTVGVLILVGRFLSQSTIASVAGALFLAFSPIYWSQATGSDKYTLNALFLALVVLMALYWSEKPGNQRLTLLAFVYGLSLTNHRSMLLAAPGLLVFILANGWRPNSSVLRPALFLFLPLTLYLYVPGAGGRGLPPGTWPVSSPSELMEFFLDRGYTSQIQLDAGSGARLGEFVSVSVRQLGLAGILLGILGVGLLLRSHPRFFLLVLLIFIPSVLTAANYLLPSNYAIPRHWVFFIPAYVCWAIFISAGVQLLLMLASRGRPVSKLGMIPAAIIGLLVLAGGALVWAPAGVAQARAHRSAETLDGYRQDLQRGYLADRFARLSLKESALDAIIVGDWEQATALWYLQYVEGVRHDVVVRYPMERLDETLNDPLLALRPVYITRALTGVERFGPTSAVGPLIEVRGQLVDPSLSRDLEVDATVGETARLVGVTYLADDVRVGSVLPLVLYWQALGVSREDASVSVRLVNSSGDDVAQSDVPQPVLGTSPMRLWNPGAVIGDYHELAVSNRLVPGEYRVEALLYRGPTAAPLAVTGGDASERGDRVRLPAIQVRS